MVIVKIDYAEVKRMYLKVRDFSNVQQNLVISCRTFQDLLGSCQ